MEVCQLSLKLSVQIVPSDKFGDLLVVVSVAKSFYSTNPNGCI